MMLFKTCANWCGHFKDGHLNAVVSLDFASEKLTC